MIPRELEPEVMDSEAEALDYEAMDHGTPNRAFLDRLRELGARGRMLDLGTGPGHIPVLVCREWSFASVVAADLAASMLRLAKARFAREGFQDRIQTALLDAKALPFPDAAFDVVFSNTVLHHIPDPRPFLSEATRVLRPGGALLIRDLFRPDSLEEVERLVSLYSGGSSESQRQLFRASLRAAFTAEELRNLLVSLGIRAEVTIDSDRHVSIQRRTAA